MAATCDVPSRSRSRRTPPGRRCLECIRLHYLNRPSPLAKTLELYREFFALFGDFEGYVEHFLFQDLVKGGHVATFLPLDLAGAGLPRRPAEYEMFMERSIAFVQARNARITALELAAWDDLSVIACGARPCALRRSVEAATRAG